MYKSNSIAVVVPCFNEEKKISQVVQTMPDYVDHIYVVDDHSSDSTLDVLTNLQKDYSNLIIIEHTINQGVGAAICIGYKKALQDGIDIIAVMAGDAQMDPDDLPNVLDPIVDGRADYVKGNRFFSGIGTKAIPKQRLIGNVILSAFTKIASGYWHLSDTQCGYTAISKECLSLLDLDNFYARYGYPNDMLTTLNIVQAKVAEVPVKPVYGPDWSSKMKISKVVFLIIWLLIKCWLKRLFVKYVYLNGHPIVFFYGAVLLFVPIDLSLFFYIIIKTIISGAIPKASLIIFGITISLTLQILLSAFIMDYDDNKHLYVIIRSFKSGIK